MIKKVSDRLEVWDKILVTVLSCAFLAIAGTGLTVWSQVRANTDDIKELKQDEKELSKAIVDLRVAIERLIAQQERHSRAKNLSHERVIP